MRSGESVWRGKGGGGGCVYNNNIHDDSNNNIMMIQTVIENDNQIGYSTNINKWVRTQDSGAAVWKEGETN